MKKLFCVFFGFIVCLFSCSTLPDYHATAFGISGAVLGSVNGPSGTINGLNTGSNIGYAVDAANILISTGKGICSLFIKKKKKFVYTMTEDEYMENYYIGAESLDNNTNDMDLIYAPSSKLFSFSDRGDSDIPTYSIKDQFNYFMAL